MNQSLRTAFYKNRKLLVIAACLYAISILITGYLTYTSSPKEVVKKLETRLQQNEKSFSDICANTILLDKLTKDTVTEEATYLQKLPFGVFVYVLNDVGNPLLTYWNSNQFYLPLQEIPKKDGSYFITNQNGNFELIKKSVVLNGQKGFTSALIPIRWHYFIDNK